MLNLPEYLERNTNGYRITRVFRRKADSLVALVSKPDGSERILRIYDHPIPAYYAIRDLEIAQLPHVYDYRIENGNCIVDEEYVNGISLTEVIEVCRMDTSQTAAIGEHVCRALQALHRKGIIHRDVKPDNVLISSAGRVVLIDLDAASEYAPEKERDTCLLGTAGYAAPEQFGFSRSDVRTDIFSLGVMLNVMMTGEHPSRKLAEGPIRAIIERCIEVNADKRYSSVVELGKKLAGLAGTDSTCPQCGCTTPGGGCLCCGNPSEYRGKGKKKRFIVTGVLCAAVLCALMTAQWRDRRETGKPIEPFVDETPSLEKPENSKNMPASEVSADSVPVNDNSASENEDTPKVESGDKPTVENELPKEEMPVYPGEFVFGVHESEPFSVLIDGEEQLVCMAVDHCSSAYPNQSGAHSIVVSEGEYVELFYGVGFFRKVGEDRYLRISDEKKMNVIRERLGDSLKIEVLAYQDSKKALPECFPESEKHQCANGCLDGFALRVGKENRGTYILCASAEVDGKELSSEFRLEWLPTSEIKFRYDPDAGEMIDQINRFLENLTYDETYTVTIDIPAGNYEGQIVVPDHLRMMEVNISGPSSETGRACVIRGGVDNRNHRATIRNIRFEGAGIGLEEIPSQWPDGRENIAFSGGGGGTCTRCEFEGYNVAIRSAKRLKTGTNNLFVNNGAAFLFDTLNADGGSGGMEGNEFRKNDIAIRFKTLNENWSASWFRIKNCRFVDNGIDLCNEIGRDIEIRDSYFADTVNEVEVERECREVLIDKQN